VCGKEIKDKTNPNEYTKSPYFIGLNLEDATIFKDSNVSKLNLPGLTIVSNNSILKVRVDMN